MRELCLKSKVTLLALLMILLTGCSWGPDWKVWPRGQSAPFVTQQALESVESEEQAAALKSFPVLRYTTERSSASAIAIAPDLIMCSRHQLPRKKPWIKLNDRSTRLLKMVLYGDQMPNMLYREQFQLLDDYRTIDDWAVIRIDPPVPEEWVVRLDPHREVKYNDPLYCLGFWAEGVSRYYAKNLDLSELEIESIRKSCRRTVVECRVLENIDDWTPLFQSSLFAIHSHFQEEWYGISGGPAVRWDSNMKKFVVVGVFSTFCKIKYPQGGTGVALKIRRIPEEVLFLLESEGADSP